MTLINNMRNAFATDASRDDADRGQLVEMVLIIAGFAIVAILAVNWIGASILNKGANVANCIEGSSTYTTTSDAAGKNCAKGVKAKQDWKADEGFTKRYS